MDLVSELREATHSHWKDALLWSFLVVVGSLLPLWGGALLFQLFGSWPGFTFFLSHGEFYIYSAAILSPTLYTLHSIYRVNVFTVLSYVILLSSAILFAGTASRHTADLQVTVDEQFLRMSSVVLLSYSVVFTFLTKVAENVKRVPDLAKMKQDDFEALDRGLDALEGGRND